MAEYWKVTHRHRPYNIIPVAFYVTLEGKIPRTPLSFMVRSLMPSVTKMCWESNIILKRVNTQLC